MKYDLPLILCRISPPFIQDYIMYTVRSRVSTVPTYTCRGMYHAIFSSEMQNIPFTKVTTEGSISNKDIAKTTYT